MKNNKLKSVIIILIVLIVVAGGIYVSKQKNKVPISVVVINTCKENGTRVFKYQENSNDPTELYTTLLLFCDRGILKGYMFGPYPAQEHGLFYFSNVLEDLKIEGINISFKISNRDFVSQPFTLENYMNKPKRESFDRENLVFSGIIDQNSINLTCQSDPLECYSETMKFVEVKP